MGPKNRYFIENGEFVVVLNGIRHPITFLTEKQAIEFIKGQEIMKSAKVSDGAPAPAPAPHGNDS